METRRDHFPSLWHLNGTHVNICKEHGHRTCMLHLQQRLQELKCRECVARHNNKELLQQFDKAQDTLREMVAATAAMKTVRLEYEHHLEASAPCWQQQKEDTQGHHTTAQQKHLLAESAHRPVLPAFLQHAIAPVSHPQCGPGLNATRWASNPDNGPWSSVGMPSGSDGHLCMEDSPAHHAGTCSSSSHSSQELDAPSVRSASEHAEHVGSTVSRPARTKKKGSTFAENRCSSQGSSRRSSAAVSGGQSSSRKGSTDTIRRNVLGLALGSPKMKNKGNDQKSPTSSSLRKSPGEDAGSGSPFNQSESREHPEWGSGSNKAVGSKDREEELDSGEDEETSQGDESEEDGEDLSDEVNEKDPVSLQEEEDNVDDTDEEEEREDDVDETDEEEEQREDDVEETDEEEREDEVEETDEEEREDNVEETEEPTSEEESDSDDSIIAPLQKRAEIPQEASDGREESTRRSDEDSSDVFDDKIENLLAPQTQKIQEKDEKAEEEHKETCNVKISPAETHRLSDSDDFDQFYD
ncbi:dentin sialophosphoprotein-like isoform X2 [Nerophis ophidion]|uniref:dentin sialophosphoprotein-like isoform X2 n=1 Tax=Nerophis ophidion TaxID=159077 RepID=UPI002ADF18C9|nr:dentin sialophosphoprotein-like isoform X2 [Nerophis ophidion]